MKSVEINGDEPPIVGMACEAVIAVELQHDSKVFETATVTWLRFSAPDARRWHRLYFEYDCVFWRVADEDPVEFEAEEIHCSFKLVDVGAKYGLVGQRLCRIGYVPLPPDGVQVELRFEHGYVLLLTSQGDVTNWSVRDQ